MIKKLSKSACEKYMQCPASFDYYYNQKIEPIKVGSALVFGSAIDDCLNAILLKMTDWRKEFDVAFSRVPLGEMVPHALDYDGELLSEEDKTTLLNEMHVLGYPGDNVDAFYKSTLEKLDNGGALSPEREKCFDLVARAGLKAKAELFFIAYQKHVMPYIEKVYNVQKASGPGYLDATVEWYKRGKVILDHKTSGKRYPDNAVEYSAQLAMYAAEEKVNDVAYIVFIKNIKKNRIRTCSACGTVCKNNKVRSCDVEAVDGRCGASFVETIAPEAEIQIIHGEITNRAMEVASELQSEIRRATDAKIFPCNVSKCNDQYGKPCVYRDLKWKGDMTGLRKREFRK